jgi:hypothetical protein
MTSLFELLVTFVKALAGAVAILLGAFLFILLFGRIRDKLRGSKRDFGQIISGILTLLLGLGFLSSWRSALLYHTTIYFKGWIYPWQALIGGSLSAIFGAFLVIHGIYRKNKRGPDN